MNSILILITHEKVARPPNGHDRYFRLDADLSGVPLEGSNFHFMIESSDYDVVVDGIEWEVHADGQVKPVIHLIRPGNRHGPPYTVNEPGDVEWLLKAGWKEVNSPYSEPR